MEVMGQFSPCVNSLFRIGYKYDTETVEAGSGDPVPDQ